MPGARRAALVALVLGLAGAAGAEMGREGVVPGFAVATLKQARRLIVAVVGGTVLLIGLALLVLPGPAFLVIPLGLGILATEFVWARRLLRRVKREAGRIASSLGGGPGPGRRP